MPLEGQVPTGRTDMKMIFLHQHLHASFLSECQGCVPSRSRRAALDNFEKKTPFLLAISNRSINTEELKVKTRKKYLPLDASQARTSTTCDDTNHYLVQYIGTYCCKYKPLLSTPGFPGAN